MRVKAIIFDVDGVLMDSVPFHFKAWNRLFTEEGIPFTYEDYLHKVNGLPRLTGIANMAPSYPKEKLEEMAERKQQYFLESIDADHIEPLPGVTEFLQQLQEKDLILAAASSSKNARHLLERAGINTFFKAIITGNDFTHSKPHPEIFLTAAERISMFPQDCAVIEDASLGIEAAKNAKMVAIGLLSSDDPVIEKKSDFVVRSISEFPLILSYLNKK